MGIIFGRDPRPTKTRDEAMTAYADALAKLEAECVKFETKTNTHDNLKGFLTTRIGQKLDAELVEASKRKKAIELLVGGGMVNLGTVYVTSKLQPWAFEMLCQVAAEHGGDPSKWPKEINSDVTRKLQQPNAQIVPFGEVAKRRRLAIAGAYSQTVRAAIEKHGNDPSRWPDALLDDVARLERRAVGFDRLVEEARGMSSGWDQSHATYETSE